MERAVEWYLVVTLSVIGLSHLVRPGDWAEAYRQMHKLGRPGAFVNGWLSLVSGALVVAGHRSWSWPGGVLTGFGWFMVIKGAGCLMLPDKALRSMERASGSPRGFVAGGALALALGGWAGYCVWCGG